MTCIMHNTLDTSSRQYVPSVGLTTDMTCIMHNTLDTSSRQYATISIVIMPRMAPGAITFYNKSSYSFFGTPGAISPMGAISPIPVRKYN